MTHYFLAVDTSWDLHLSNDLPGFHNCCQPYTVFTVSLSSSVDMEVLFSSFIVINFDIQIGGCTTTSLRGAS